MTRGEVWCFSVLVLLCWPTTFATPPVFSSPASDGSSVWQVAEDAADGTAIDTLTATDADTGDILTYSIVTSPSEFQLSGQVLQVKTGASLDYETTQTYSLTVRVNDGTSDVDAAVTVNVVNKNDESPTFSNPTYTATLAEGQSPGTVLTFTGLAVTDTDANDVTLGEQLTYSLEGTDSAVFTVDSQTGQISTAQQLDRETTATYTQLTLKVTDAASHSATASLTVSVTDINDVTPSCTPAVYYATVAENTGSGVSLTTLTGCSDTDTGVNGQYTATIFSGDPGTVFALTAGLELQTGATATDYEGTQSYTLTVHLVDQPASGTANTGTATIVVTVTGVNDNNPAWATWTPNSVFTGSATSVSEDVTVGSSLFTIAATDGDQGSDGSVIYSFDSVVYSSSASAVGVFRVDPVSGEVSTLQTLDRDAGVTSYTVTVKADDGGGSPLTRAITVTLDDVNDNDPVFASYTYQKTLAETAATAGASLVQVAATDADASSTLTYSVDSVVTGNTAGKFTFSGSTAGQLELATAIDLDSGDDAYSVIRILVTDDNAPSTVRTGTATVTVSITATNDHTPAFGATVPATSPITLDESTAPGTLVATVTATDQDFGSDGVVTYSITAGNTNNAFTIVSSTGQIQTLTDLDYETTSSYDLEVTATDGGTTAKSASATVSIAINNQNDNAPSCSNYVIAVTLPENATVNDAVTSLSCTDADGDTLTYTFTSGNADGKFAIGTNTGAITLAQTVDYDSATQSYTLQVSVTDTTYTQSVTVRVILTPVNQATPSFATNPTQSVSESEAAGYAVTTYVATDSDYSPHAITTYAITAVTQSGSSKFTIDQSSGAISLLAPLDYDTLPSGNKNYELTVTATDGGGLFGSGTVTVAVQDSNDNSPICTQSSWTETVLESVSSFPHSVIASLGCTDTEDGTTLTYALTPGSSLFSVVSGGIQLDSAVDYETSTSHTLTVVVTDSGSPANSISVIVNVFVQNANDGAPTFGGPYDVNVAENVAVGTSVADVSATDPDGVSNAFGNPQHSILSGDPSGHFNIDSSTGRVTTRALLDVESTAVYTMVVKAVEQGGSNSATITLTVSVTDINDVTPSCNVNTFAETVLESAAANSAVLTLTCTDSDVTASTLTYSIAAGDTSKFTMNSNVLELAAQLDYESGTTSYPLTISVSDGTNTAQISGSVNVGPVNEDPPVFSQTTYSVTKSESLAVGSTVAQVASTDDDSSNTADGVVTYAFDSPQTVFTINSATGVILLASSLDRETQASYSLLVTASDPATTVTATVSLTVSDENDNAPVFTSATYTGSMSETDAAGATVVTVAANDFDDSATNGNGAVTYSSTIGGDTNGHFTIDVNSGVITTTTQLDADTLASYTLTITATDRAGGSGAMSGTAVVLVTVTRVNQHDPAFTQATYTANTDETTPVGTQLVQVSATDDDTGSDGTVTYSMTTHAKFSLAADGWISVRTALDFETAPNTYSLEVVATDGGGRTDTATVSITVGDVNDNTAMCTPSFISLQKREDATGAVTTLSCTDADSGTNAALTYSISSVNGVAGAGNFAVDGSGAVTVSALDYETATSLEVVILVADSGTVPRSTTVYLTLTVIDVNENAPAFSGTPLTDNVAESDAAGMAVMTVAAADADGSDVITYSLSDTTHLEVDSTTGEIKLKTPFDFETTPTYTVNVCAEDSNTVDAVKSTCETITLTITDANDNDPVFNPSLYTANVDENAADGTTVTTVTATDADTLAAGGTISYTLVSGNTDSVFRVDPSAGHVIVDDRTYLDYERTTIFTLTVRVSDGGGRTADAVVTINVNALNEATPTFTPSSSTETVAENAATGTVVTVSAADTDSGSDGALTYTISSGASGKFSVNPASGEVSLVGNLDRETAPLYTLEIEAVDGGSNPSAKTGTYTLTIDVTDVNDVTPSCSATFYAATVSESAAVADSVITITCSDSDQDPANLNNDVTYAITGGDTGGKFSVDASGTVKVAAALDRETTSSYSLMIEVADKATTGKLTATVTVQVDVTDENDNDPVFSADPYTASVAENSAMGFTVETVSASDTDSGSNAAITYSLTSASPAGKFSVDPNTGDVTVAADLDFETTTAYTLVVTATDQGVPPRSASSTVSITVTDVDDNTPVCVSSVYSATLAEDANPATATVVTVACPDVDTPTVTYTLTDPLFSVSATGVVTLSGALDYETDQVHTLTVTASDGTRSDSTIVRVTVTDVNEFDPIFDPTIPYSANVPEDSPISFTVKDVGATDSDFSDTALTFSITGGNADGKFNMDSVSGVIVLQGTLDRETTDTFTLNLEVADGTGAGSRTATTSIVVTVDDVNDNDPTCTQNSYIASVAEDASAVITLSCSDVDTSTPTVRYTLQAAGNTGTAFSIDPSSGALTVTGTIDYETLTSYSLSVEVDDQGTPDRTTTVPVTVTITPVNEAPPVWAASYPNTDVIESTAVGSVILSVAATDNDQGLQHGTVRYSIESGNGQGDFVIDSSTGQIAVAKPLDREATASYTFTVRAADDVAGSADERTADVTVGITITDTNDNYPVFTPATYTTTIQETAAVSGTVLTVTVTDDDTGPNAAVTVSIVSGNTGSAFSVSGTDLILANTLDYETTTTYDLVLQAVDGGSPALSSQARISIAVGAVNEDAPILTDTAFSANISEDEPLGTLIYTALATDTDQGGSNDGSITYNITAGDSDPNSFIIDPNSGEVRVFSRLDFDTPPQDYNLTVEARDGGDMTDTVVLTLTLTDVNDHTPQFATNTFTTNLDENVNTGHSVYTITATDNDSGLNGQISYSVTDGNGQTLMAVDPTSGEVTTTAAIDYESTPILYLVVQAADGGNASLSSTALLRINVIDLNDNPPVVIPDDYTVTLSEADSIGTQVATIGATDADSAANNNNVVVFSLTSTDFAVDPATGVVTTTATLDREATPSGYVLKVVATDQGTTPGQNSATATITVSLSDVNDNSPIVTGTYDFTEPEDTAVGTVIFQITAADADIGKNGRLTYSILTGNTNNDLNIIDTIGMVQVAKTLDRETTDKYTLAIQVADNGSPALSTTVTATLTISDVNDNDPVLTGTPYAFSVPENSIVGVVVDTLVATDADTGLNANLVYSIQNFWSGDSSYFTLDAATGQLKTATTALDRETRDTYLIWCRVNDQGTNPMQRHADVNVTVTITDINDNPPIFNPVTYSGSVQENAAVDTSVLSLTATDADIGANADIAFTLDTSTAAGTKADTYLKVDVNTGVISVKANIDYETDTTFTFEVKATDQGSPAFTATATVTVAVVDVNDNNPTFTTTFVNTEVAYGAQCSNAVTQLTCNDADSGVNGQVACYLTASTYDYLFSVNGSSCAVTTQSIASANFRYLVTVQCRDAGTPTLTAATPVTVRTDTFIPDNVVVVFRMTISRADFELKQTEFVTNIAAVLHVTYPKALLRLWCIQEREGTAVSPNSSGRRRRLLQSAQPVDVMVYAVQDNTTELSTNTDQDKDFLTTDELMAFFAADASGTPSSSITGTAWDYYGIEQVTTYTENNSAWIETPEGIAVVTVCCLLAFVFICILIYILVRCYRKSKRPVTPVRAVLVEPHDGVPSKPPSATHKPRSTWIKNDTDGVPDLDKSSKAAAAGLPTAAIAATAFAAYKKKKGSQQEANRADDERKRSVASPRTVLLTTQDEEDNYRVINRQFDGRALDPMTGKVYEYSTKTQERRWLDSPPGYNV